MLVVIPNYSNITFAITGDVAPYEKQIRRFGNKPPYFASYQEKLANMGSGFVMATRRLKEFIEFLKTYEIEYTITTL